MDPSKLLFNFFIFFLYASTIVLCKQIEELPLFDTSTPWFDLSSFFGEITFSFITTGLPFDEETTKATARTPPMRSTTTTAKSKTTTGRSTTTIKTTISTPKPATRTSIKTSPTNTTTTTAKSTSTASIPTTHKPTTTSTKRTTTTKKPAGTNPTSATKTTSALAKTTLSTSSAQASVSCGLPTLTPCLPSPSSNGQCPKQKIVGGREAQPYSYPWQVALFTSDGSFFCGGSIVHQQWIITAAHCVQGNSAASVKVLVGAHSKQETNRFSASQIIVHPNYNANTNDNDIALLKLTASLTFNAKISPVCVAKPSIDEVGITTPVVATGWGTMGDGKLPNVLQEVQLALMAAASCNRAYGGRITAQMICASGSAKDTCQGDSGGPLVYKHPTTGRFTLVGVTSFGEGCADPKYPGVYAKVSAFHSWLSKYIPNL